MTSNNLFYNKKDRIKIAFILNFDFYNWHGGFNVILNLIEGIKKNSKRYEIIFVTRNLLSTQEKKILKKKTIIKTDIFNKNRLSYYYNLLQIFFFGKSYNYESFFIKNNIKIVSHTICAGINSLTKSIFWIPDLQHLEIKSNFSIIYRLMREINFRLAIKNSNIILFSSQTVLQKFKKYYNFYKIKFFVNRFSCLSGYKINKKAIQIIKDKYGIRNKYFYIGNQYWEHKNFELIVESLKYLKNNLGNNKIQIVSSGSSVGKYGCIYFKKIIKSLKDNNLQDNFLYIGIVPHNEVDILIAGSLAVINPSLYEGWNATVEQAKSLNKKIILSDIQVHREQRDCNSYLIKSDNYISLAKILDNLQKKKSNYLKLNNSFLKKNKIIFNGYIKNYLKVVNKLAK
jgi:hypothetical protein